MCQKRPFLKLYQVIRLLSYKTVNIKIILTVLIAAALISCSIFEHKKPSLSDNSQIAAPIPNNSVNKNSHQLVQSERQLKDFLDFKKIWNTRVLKKFQEKQLENVTNKSEEVYRFFWIPSFDNAIAIRVWQVGEKYFLVVRNKQIKEDILLC